MALMQRFIKDQRGIETVEWSVIAALIALGLAGVIGGLGSNLVIRFQRLINATTTP
ncbi:MAG: Flp family type IVb pilin [Planctomycetota bacterium]|jgi:Flp pilus assembly pilin Flp